jgi:deoxyhypusine monooxygenase
MSHVHSHTYTAATTTSPFKPNKTCREQGGEQQGGGEELDRSPFLSVDPAPADRKELSTAELKARLLDASLPLFARYRAMFSLRNRNTEEAVLALAAGFHDASALFRHEVAYVMGQMQHPASVPSLKTVLEDEAEHRMVRHEAAEALGAVGGGECEAILEKFRADGEVVVRESCVVALDTMEYWAAGNGGGSSVGGVEEQEQEQEQEQAQAAE